MYTEKKHPGGCFSVGLKFLVLPTSYFPDNVSIIAVHGLNFSVRNGKRCDPRTKSGEQKTQISHMLL